MAGVIDYFDLNRRAGVKRLPPNAKVDSGGAIGNWRGGMSIPEQLLMYGGVVVGVMFSSSVQQFKAGTVASIEVTRGTVALAAIVGLVIVPQVFEKLKVHAEAPLIVKVGLFVQNGVFWQVMFSAIGKAM